MNTEKHVIGELEKAAVEVSGLPSVADQVMARVALTMDNVDPPAALSGAVMDQNLPGETRTQRRTIWRMIMTHRYAAASVACVAAIAIAVAVIVALQMPGDADSDLASHGESNSLKPLPSDAHLQSRLAETSLNDLGLKLGRSDAHLQRRLPSDELTEAPTREKRSRGPKIVQVRGKVIDDETGEPIAVVITQAGKFDPADPTTIPWGYSQGRSRPR